MCVGKYQPGVDRPDPKTWKANFRCAMNSLPDIEEVKDKSIKKGTNAFRVYKILSSSERGSKKGECCDSPRYNQSFKVRRASVPDVLPISRLVPERRLYPYVCAGKKKSEREGRTKGNGDTDEQVS